jgi:hypothetical protein
LASSSPTVLKGHGFSRAIEAVKTDAALAAEGMKIVKTVFPPGLKPRDYFSLACGTTKVVPLQSIGRLK